MREIQCCYCCSVLSRKDAGWIPAPATSNRFSMYDDIKPSYISYGCDLIRVRRRGGSPLETFLIDHNLNLYRVITSSSYRLIDTLHPLEVPGILPYFYLLSGKTIISIRERNYTPKGYDWLECKI